MSKATNRLIQEQVTEARRNIDLTTIIAVAVSGYRHLAPLAGPRRDLDMIREIFVENPDTRLYREDQLITLLDPTSAQLRVSVLQYAESRGARGDVVIIYFSGHGSVLGGGEFLLCTTDSRTSGLEGGGVLSTSAVLFKDIALTLSSCDVRPVFIIDACFSGTTALADGFQIGQMVQNETFTFGNTYGLLCSSSAEVESKDTPQGGAFTLRFHQSIQEGSGNASDRNRPLLTVNDITIPLLDHLARDGYPLPRLFVGPQLPQIAIAKNTQYQPERIRFEPYMKRLVEHLWNKGNPREIAIRALRQNEWMGAYGNHRKLSYSPWQLLEDGSSRRHRRLTKRGEEFARGDLQIVESIIKDPGTWEWVADPYAEMISISDV
jgi:hypothetical protein